MGVGKRGRTRLEPLLIAHHFSPMEARELATLRRMTPTLRSMIKERDIRRGRFENLAAGKIARGEWSREEVVKKWWKNISRMYSSQGWRVQEGARGTQHPMPRGFPNPWCWYRAREKTHPDPKHVSPWELRRHYGKTKLERGLVFVQQLEKGARTATQTQLRLWIGQKENAVAKARGARKEQLRIELGRLERLLEGAS